MSLRFPRSLKETWELLDQEWPSVIIWMPNTLFETTAVCYEESSAFAKWLWFLCANVTYYEYICIYPTNSMQLSA
jgi:hypothetical protein